MFFNNLLAQQKKGFGGRWGGVIVSNFLIKKAAKSFEEGKASCR